MKRRLLVALCLALTTIFVALGAWQIERRGEKLALIARIAARVHAPPVPLPPRQGWAADHRYRRVRVTGTLLHRAETLVQAVTVRGPGWWVMTPLRTGPVMLLVNRGFVPNDRRDHRTRAAGQAGGTVTITGLLRASEPGGGFLQSNDPAADRWHSRDVAAIARARRLRDAPPFFLDADSTGNPGGLPVGGLTIVSFPNNHAVYAAIWFALAALAAAAAARLGRLRTG